MSSDVNRTIEEQLSAFLDGELADEELDLLVRRLEKDSRHRATIARYALIGNVMRSEPVQLSADQFRSSVMAAIEAGDDPIEAADETAVVEGSAWWRPAAAAAVLMLAVGAGLNMDFSTEAPGDGLASTSTSTIVDPSDALAGLASAKQSVASSGEPVYSDRLTSYFVSHGEYARSFQGPMTDPRIFVQQARFED